MSDGRTTLYVATSVDGFLADEDGAVGWLDGFEEDGNGYDEFFAGVDCLVVGATTYEQILGFGEWPYEDRPTYVFTHRDLPRATDAVRFVDGAVGRVADDLERRYDHVWVVGGAQLARAFLREGLVDELRLSLIPVLLGSGIPLFSANGGRWPLRLLETVTHDSGMVELRYRVAS